LRTQEYSYARTVQGPWFLFDLAEDPYEMMNLVDEKAAQSLVGEMDKRLNSIMKETGDSWEYKATTGDIDAWLNGGPKQESQNLGVPWPGSGAAAASEKGAGSDKRKKKAGKKKMPG
jgi:hypothetical protein